MPDFGPHPAEDVKWNELVDQLVHPDERMQAVILGEQRWLRLLYFLPYVGDFLDSTRKYFVAYLTDQRLFLIRLKKPLFLRRAAEWYEYPLDCIEEVVCHVGLLESTVRIWIRNGQSYKLRGVAKEAGVGFEEQYGRVKDTRPSAFPVGVYSGHNITFRYPPTWKLSTKPLNDAQTCWQISLDPPEGTVNFIVIPCRMPDLPNEYLTQLEDNPLYQNFRHEKVEMPLAGHWASGFDFWFRLQGVAFSGEVMAVVTESTSLTLSWQVSDEDKPKIMQGVTRIQETLQLLTPAIAGPPGEEISVFYAEHGVEFWHPVVWVVEAEPIDRARRSWKFSIKGTEGTVVIQFYPSDVAAGAVNSFAKQLRSKYPNLMLSRETCDLAGQRAIGFGFQFLKQGIPHSGGVWAAGSADGTLVFWWQAADLNLPKLKPGLEMVRRSLRIEQD